MRAKLGIAIAVVLAGCGADLQASVNGTSTDGTTVATQAGTEVGNGSTTNPLGSTSSQNDTTGSETSADTSVTDDTTASGAATDDTESSGDTTDTEPAQVPIRVITFNTGTTPGLAHNSDGDAYGATQAEIADDEYGNGLAWEEAIDGAAAYFANAQPDIVAFQEIFHPGDCAVISAEFHPGFVCEGWSEGDLTVAQRVLGEDYQIACNLGRPDKCAAVHQSFGVFAGCDGPLCLDGLDGAPVPDCGGGSRVGRGVIELVEGGTLTIATMHGTSGFAIDDWNCRTAQVEQIFEDMDGEPAANGDINIVLGDLNTDPYRALVDLSALRWLDFVGQLGGDKDFWFISEAGPDAVPTYTNLFNIDHVISDTFVGTCIVPGISLGVAAVLDTVYFDHHPIVCDLVLPR